ncbi:MAG: hypothetical protein AB1610_00775 [Nitrospirota bacterium]
MKKIAIRLIVILLGISLSFFIILKSIVAQEVAATNSKDAEFQKSQAELNKEKHRKKVVSRFEVMEGLRGLTVKDISLALLDYSYHYLNDSGRRQPFVTVHCRIDISKFEKDAEKLREHLKSTGMRAPIEIQLPDTERTIIGLLDDVKGEFVTFAALPKSMKPLVQFANLRKNKPEYVILTLEPNENCTDCDLVNALSTAVFGFDEQNKTHFKILEVKTYRRVYPDEDIEKGIGYIEKSTVSWSDWINNEYRELIISTERELLDGKTDTKLEFKNKKEIYSWINDKELSLVERIVDGKSTMNRRGRRSSAGAEVILKDGELYEISGKEKGNKITSTNGKINSYLLSPDRRYVAYSMGVGYTDSVGLYEEGEEPGQVPVYHIVVMDLELKKILKEVKPPSEDNPFIYVDKWISNDELLLHDADGFAVSSSYIYNAGTNELRLADIEEQEMNL